MDANIFERVRGIASDVFECSAPSITSDSSPETVETWDSVRHLNFILALEEIFQVQLSAEETDRIRTIGSAVELIEQKARLTEK